MPFYAPEAIAEFDDCLATLEARAVAIIEAYAPREYRTTEGAEFAQYGFSRRIATIARCVQKVFSLIPPDLDRSPPEEALDDVTVNIQAFVFNVFGAVDNLAWIWIAESSLRARPRRVAAQSTEIERLR